MENGNRLLRTDKINAEMIRTILVIAALSFGNSGTLNAISPFQDSGTSFQLKMRDGTLIGATCKDESVMWKSVSHSGEVTQSKIRLHDVKSITFATESASEQVAAVRKLLNSLNDDDYRIRNEAESKLVSEGHPFLSIIEKFPGHSEPEAKYRLARVLDRLKNERDDVAIPSVLQFDVLETTDGQRLEGDIGDWALVAQWNNVTISADRNNCSEISSSTGSLVNPQLPSPGVPVTGQSVTSIDYFLENGKPRPGTTFVDFETGNGNLALPSGIKDPVERLFSFAGCLFHCDTNDGNVIISSYKFKRGVSRSNSLCNLHYDPVLEKTTRFTGVMRIEFCVPGQPETPAGVVAAGLGAEIVVPKQTLVEAWNSAGHVIGLTWAVEERNSFLGTVSSEPIVALTVGANRFLNLEKVNEDYAIDDLCFSKPVAVPDLNRFDEKSISVIITESGDRLMVDSITFQADESRLEFALGMNRQTISLPMDEISWIIGPQHGLPRSPQFDGVSVMTRDGSVIHTSFPGLMAIDNPGLEIPEDEVIGVWNPSTPARYPRSGDFSLGNAVVVRPMNRIAGNATLDWNSGSVDFDLNTATTIRQSMLPGSESDETSVTELIDLEVEPFEGNSFNINELTNLWTAMPKLRSTGTGLLRTADGQQFVLGGESGFLLSGADGTTVTISRDGQTLSFELNQIYALEFPDE